MPVDHLVILAFFIDEDHLQGGEVCIDILFPLLLKVFIMLSSCPVKELESHPSIVDVHMECSPGDVNLVYKCNPILDFTEIYLWCLLQ